MVPSLPRPAAWRVVTAIAATYTYFLLFAQFGLLSVLQQELATPARVDAAMAAMGLSGLAGSLLTGRWLGRLTIGRAVPLGLLACAAVALVAPLAHGFLPLLIISAATGLSVAFLTVSLAAGLRDWLPAPRFGLLIGAGTGLAYALSNVPALFTADPALRAAGPGLFCAVAGLLLLRPPLRAAGWAPPEHGGLSPIDVGRRGVLGFALAFAALVGLDSAAFAVLQQQPALNALAWGSDGRRISQGIAHALAALLAGWLIDRAAFRGLLLATYVIFVLAFAALIRGVEGGGPLYAAGISFYSTALVAYPGLRRDGVAPRWRSALVYGAGGWLGSALGVGLAQHVHHIPLTAVLGAGALLLGGMLIRRPAAARALIGPALGVLAGAVVLGATRGTHPVARATTPEARGRAVYVREGCINCHSQFVRPDPRDELWWGPARGYDRSEQPPLIGNRRLGPDLLNVGNRRFANWNELHLRQPAVVSPGSRMPSYAHLFTTNNPDGPALVAYLATLGATTVVERMRVQDTWYGPPGLARGSAERGRAVFAAHCTGCHGVEGGGDGPLAAQLPWPALNLRKGPLHIMGGKPADPQRIARLIKFGWTGTPMAGHEYLPDADLADVTAYVLALADGAR